MATDRTIIPAQGVGGDTNVPVATRDDASSLKHQKVLAEYLVGTTPTEVDASHPFPVVQTGTPGLPTGASTEATLATASGTLTAQSTLYGALTESAPASDTASSGLNGRLQRIAQRLTSLIALLPTSLGQKTMANGLAVTIASDQSAVPITDNAGSVTVDAPVATPVFVRLSDGTTAIATLPISAAALPLPAGASTEATLAAASAKLPAALGAHGGLVIEGVASGVAIPVTGGGTPTDLTATGNITAPAQSVTITGMNALSTVVTNVSGTFTGLTLIYQGSLDGTNWFNLPAWEVGTPTSIVSSTFAATGNYVAQIAGWSQVRVTCGSIATGTAVLSMRASSGFINARNIGITGTIVTNIAQMNGVTTTMGNGVSGTGVQRVTIASDSTGQIALAAGAAAIGSVTTELATGLTTFYNGALSNAKTAVKAGAGKVYGWMIHNPSAATTFIQVWNVAIGSITVGTTAATWEIPIPAGASANVFTDRGITHSTEINIAATTTAGGSSAPATACVVSMFYI